MSAPDGTPIDLRHPSWCDPDRCEADNTEIVGDHRSRVMTIPPRQPYDEKISAWLFVPVHGPVDEAPWVFVQFEDRRHNGELDSLTTYSLRLDQSEDFAEVLTTLAGLGRDRTLVEESVWRPARPATPPPGVPGNSGPGY
jgi:hypothetical protein